MGVRPDEVGRPLEVAGPDVDRGQGQFVTAGGHARDVTVLGDFTAETHRVDDTDQVVVVTLVPVAREVDPVVEEAQFRADVQLVLLFEGEIRVREAGDVQRRLIVAGAGTPVVGRPDDDGGVGDPGRAAFRSQGVGSLEDGVGKVRLQGAHPGFVGNVPTAGHVPGREPAGGTGLTQAVGAFITDGTRQAVPVHQGVGTRAEESGATFVRVGHREVVGAVLLALLEDAVVIVGEFAHGVLHAPATVPGLLAVVAVDLHTGIGVHLVVPAEAVVVGGGGTEVPAGHLVVRPLVDTAVREDGDRVGILDVRILIEVGVVAPDGGRAHRPVSERLVGIVQDVVLAGRLRVLAGEQGGEFQVAEHLPLEFALETHVGHVQVQVVAVQLVEDVERRIVPGVVFVRIQRPGRVEGVGIRVDIERAVHFTAHHVRRRAQGSRSALMTVGGVADHVERERTADLVRAVDVRRIAADSALERPARVVHHGQGGVIVAAVGTTGHGDRVVVLDAVREQQVEPVGVAELGIPQVGRLRFQGVGQGELLRHGIVLAQELVHLTINTAVLGVGDVRVVQPALLFQFLVHGHLVLGIHDVEGAVERLHAERVLTGIGHRAVPGTAFLGGDDDNARHGARTVDGGRGTVLQDFEALDIVGVQTGDRGGDQGVGITGAQVLGIDFNDVFHDHAVHDPQRLGGAVDGGGTADADLRGGTERTGDVLHGDTGYAAFQGTGDIGDTVQFRLFGIHLDGGSGEDAAVHRGHTGDDRLFQHLGVRLQGDADIVPGGNGRIAVTHEGDHEILRALRYLVEDKVTVQVCEGADLGLSFHRHERADDRFSVFRGDDRAPECPCLRRSSGHSKKEGTNTEQIG